MRTAAPIPLLLAILCAPAPAEGVWKFEEGATYTWQGQTEFHYQQTVTSQPTGGPITTAGPPTIGDPQWETITLKATVLAVDPDGAGHLEFLVEAVHIETRFDTGGEHAEWDSARSPETDVEGYRRYQAMLGNKFSAVVGPDGRVRSVEGAEWAKAGPPTQAAPKKASNSRERVERAARETHDPTPPSVWLALLFGTTPDRKSEWTRLLSLPQDEKLSFRADGEEQIGDYPCAKAKLESADKRRSLKAKDVERQEGDDEHAVGAFAMALCRATRKRGTTWFSRKTGCLVKAEIEAATEYTDGDRRTDTYFKWDVVLKSRGTAPVPQADPGSTPTK